MIKREEIDRRFLELVSRICQNGKFGPGGEDMRQMAGKLMVGGNRTTMHQDLPWLTDVFFHGILSGEDVLANARASLLTQWRKLVDIGLPPTRETDGAAANESLKEWGELSDAKSVCEADRAVRLMPVERRADAASRLRRNIAALLKRVDADARTVASARCWNGKHGPLPLTDYREWSNDQLDALGEQACVEDAMLQRVETAPVDNKEEFVAERLRKQAGDLKDARSRSAAMKLTWLPEGDCELLATEVECLDLLHKLVYSVTYGLDRYGSGAIPPLHVAGRQARDGGIVGIAENEHGNVNMVLDNLATGAYLKLMDVRERMGHRTACFGPLRRHVEGPFTTDFLVGMVQNAVAGLRGRELLGGKRRKIRKVSIDEPQKSKCGEEGEALAATLPSPVETADDKKDRALFFKTVVGGLAPELLRYFSLIQSGMPKGEALKRVGAKSAHFVEREIKSILKELDKLKGEDFAELARMLRNVMEK